jgi:hypothetical protein
MPEWKEVGIGGLLALLVLREVFGFLKTKRNGRSTAGEQSVEYWREQIRELVVQILSQTIARALDQQLAIAIDTRDLQKCTNDGIIRLIAIHEARGH